MILKLNRFLTTDHETFGVLTIGKAPICFSIEDTSQEKKIAKITRIPSGIYDVSLRTYGRHHEEYAKRFPEFHKGMLQLDNVPEFSDILIHIGNTNEDTDGCILVANIARLYPKFRVEESELAYTRLYPIVVEAAMRNALMISISGGE